MVSSFETRALDRVINTPLKYSAPPCSSDWGYAWIPIVGPLVGGVMGAQLFKGVGF